MTASKQAVRSLPCFGTRAADLRTSWLVFIFNIEIGEGKNRNVSLPQNI